MGRRTPAQKTARNDAARALYRRRKDVGVCTICGGVLDAGKLKCSTCVKSSQKNMRSSFEKKSTAVRADHKKKCKDRYDRLKRSGLCIRCASEKTEDGVLCGPCATSGAESSKRSYQKSIDRGSCFGCGSPADSDLTASCRPCHEKRLVQSKEWGRLNKTHINAHHRRRRRTDIQFKVSKYLRSRLGSAFRRRLSGAKKAASAVKDLGCTIEELISFLESKFQPGMSWDNYGDWHIDHIKPLAAFDLTDAEQQTQACHFKNLQPLWAKDNLSKGSRYVN